MIIKATFEGKEMEFEVLYSGIRGRATHYISNANGRVTALDDHDKHRHEQLLVGIRPTHIHGGIEFEEVDRRSYVKPGEWYKVETTDRPHYHSGNMELLRLNSDALYIILEHHCKLHHD